MDIFLARIGQQAFNMAVRSGIALTSTLVLKKCTQLITSAQGQDADMLVELAKLQKQLDGRISIVSHAVDVIQLRSSKGNPSLKAALPLATALHQDIISLGDHLSAAMEVSDNLRTGGPPDTFKTAQMKIFGVAEEMRSLISRIDREIPLLQLAITASGENLSTNLSSGISPSRFLQASAFLNLGDTQYASNPTRAVEIGPIFVLSLYMPFQGHASQTPAINQPLEGCRFEGVRKPLWQEVIHKARVRLLRTPLKWGFSPGRDARTSPGNTTGSDGYAYNIEFIEDLDDGRLHEIESVNEGEGGDPLRSRIRESIPVRQISKIFYADTGRILNIGRDSGSNNPVLLLKRDIQTEALVNSTDTSINNYCRTIQTAEQSTASGNELWDEQDENNKQISAESSDNMPFQARILGSSRFPAHLDKEWMALEIFQDDIADDDSESCVGIDLAVGTCDHPAETKYFADKEDGTKQSSGTRPWGSDILDQTILEQMKHVCLDQHSHPLLSSTHVPSVGTANFIAGSPFAAVTMSLSLLEMLIRLSSLQESQQAHHLTTSDAVLNFFLENPSTSGLSSDEERVVGDQEDLQVGFAPYATLRK